MNIIMQHSHVNYPPSYEIVTDGRVLNALVKRGLIDEWDKIHKYINEYKMDRLSSDDRIIYNNNMYIIKYFEGCFSPFVCKVNNNNLNNNGGK
jgi:hypothetical protein